MTTFRKIEEMKIWQNAREIVKAIYIETSNEKIRSDFGLVSQMRRASVSIVSNIAEGYERGGNKEFMRYLFIAKASAGELRSQVTIANDCGYIKDENSKLLISKLITLSGQIKGLINYLNSLPENNKRK